VVNGSLKTTFSLAQLQQLQADIHAISQHWQIKGAISGPDSYVGVQVKTILAASWRLYIQQQRYFHRVGRLFKNILYAAVENGTGITVEDNNGNTVASPVAPVMFLAYSKRRCRA
jgi:hypothetical protein